MVENILKLLDKIVADRPAVKGMLTVTMSSDSYKDLCNEIGYEVKEIQGCKILVDPAAPVECVYASLCN